MSVETDAAAKSRRTESATLWTRVRRQWVLITAIILGCLLIALLVSWVRPAVYTAEARLAVGAGQMTALNIPGFPTASEQMASNYARWVNHQGVQGEIAPEGTLAVAASPIVESNVLRIEATSRDPETAVDAAATMATALKSAVNQVAQENDPEALRTEIAQKTEPLLTARADALRAQGTFEASQEEGVPQVEADRRFAAYVEAESALTEIQLEYDSLRDRYRNLVATRSTEAQLVDTLPAQLIGHDRVATTQRNALLGVLGGVVLSGAVLYLSERKPLRQRRDEVGAPIASP
ncbi:Wzz/FepE/Etk N-terminal domain-containing protein [Ornithinimicrobium pratense]|uniref:Polysaccharide chain length determinant N-terminal domain-containing protein n=1 Tax=Ornithinimicrobium pratense TaxID=2593973 RepID=A0A5J6V9B3_9MICO|nr:Wzz/FepE/Etk N-terminal domain-containing protein [Ornithinimicrobium pratense]QFG69776.1 hypothetical protein FY030_14675 [Ornithinimicrobium pratense]